MKKDDNSRMTFSFGRKLALLWTFNLIVCLSIGALLFGIDNQGADNQILLSKQTTEIACHELADKFSRGVAQRAFSSGKEDSFLSALLEVILDRYQGVEGGAWTKSNGFLGYAFPTYEGTGAKHDVPDAEKKTIAAMSQAALQSNLTRTDVENGHRQALIFTSCPLPSAKEPTALWTMTRVSLADGEIYDRFSRGLELLLLFVVISGIWIGWLFSTWSRNLRSVERQLATVGPDRAPTLELTGDKDLDRVVTAMNQLNDRLQFAKAESAALQQKLLRNERLASLGKMASGIAHEIRNPIATARLRLENAMVYPQERMQKAAPVIFDQIDRVDRLIRMLLAMTQPFELTAKTVELHDWLSEVVARSSDRAQEKSVSVDISAVAGTWSFDPFQLGRALENLIDNAIAFTPIDGKVSVGAVIRDQRLTLTVRDTGPGVSASIQQKLFEPFASERPGGTGLGLMLTKEIVDMHGGQIRSVKSPDAGACFEVEIPWLKS